MTTREGHTAGAPGRPDRRDPRRRLVALITVIWTAGALGTAVLAYVALSPVGAPATAR
ncbi:hypothetical protein [Phreatobacter cathodiphilus]|uniref:hypothetical protein n=1 Tax=Phreatobacter cathodiphilus TaxID=1868589 RepID=UPI0015E796A3|nr:hypothetical protein [Phreatobacter cathodiphilus]